MSPPALHLDPRTHDDLVAETRAHLAELVPELRPGTWVLTHTSLVLSEISESDAESINALLREGTEVGG